MEHTQYYEMIKGFYENHAWTLDRVWNVVGKPNSITQAEYKEITGFVYPNKA